MNAFWEKRFIKLNLKLLGIVLSVSVPFIIIWTLADINSQINEDNKVEKKFEEHFEQAILPAIANSAWSMNFESIQLQVEGIMHNPRIVKVQLEDSQAPDKIFYYKQREEQFAHVVEQRYPLFSPSSEMKKMPFATLVVIRSNESFVAKLKGKIYKILMSEVLEVFILSLALFYFIKRSVIQHILTISQFFRLNPYFSAATSILQLGKSGYRDELDILVDDINSTVATSKKYLAEIELLKTRAEEANRAKTAFLSMINHELRTPLSSILGVNEILQNAKDSIAPAEQTNLMQIQQRAGAYLLRLVEDVLDFSKIEAQEVKIEMNTLNLKSLLESCLQMVDLELKANGNKCVIHFPDTFPELIAIDEKRLSQVILNLLGNANKFTHGGQITIDVLVIGQEFEISICDNGIGIQADLLETIFLPFKQGSVKNFKKPRGFGVGLSISKSLVELMKGSIRVKSQLGEGSTFTIKLPLIISNSLSIQREQQSTVTKEEKTVPTHKLEILVVEDTEEIRFLVAAFLKNSVYQPVFAFNGREGFEYFQNNKVSLIFMDLQMPIMNGYEATRAIRKYEQETNRRKTPIIAMTAYTTRNDIDLAFEAGCDGYMTKPFSPKKLLSEIEQAIGNLEVVGVPIF